MPVPSKRCGRRGILEAVRVGLGASSALFVLLPEVPFAVLPGLLLAGVFAAGLEGLRCRLSEGSFGYS